MSKFFCLHLIVQRRRKPRDTATPSGSTVAESVRNLIKKNPKYSKRINYDALKDLFVDNVTAPPLSQSLNTITEDKDEENLIIMDDKSDEDETTPLVIIQEDVGAVASSSMPKANMRLLNDDDLEIASDDDKYDDEKYDDDGDWEDMYEQEI